jgi:hypothetical protein
MLKPRVGAFEHDVASAFATTKSFCTGFVNEAPK